MNKDELALLGLTDQDLEETGIKLNENYKICTLDRNNIAIKEKFIPTKNVEKAESEPKWKVIAYFPNIQIAWNRIVDKEINLEVNSGLEAVVKKITELKKLKLKI